MSISGSELPPESKRRRKSGVVSRPGRNYFIVSSNPLLKAEGVHGVRIGSRALVIAHESLTNLQEAGVTVYDNAIISFPLELPGGAGIVDNDDDWGLGPVGISVQTLWDLGATGAGVRIGIADSGLNSTLPTFEPLISQGRLAGFAAFAADGSKEVQLAGDGSPVPDSQAVPSFTHWHGTFCAATLVGANDGKNRGVAPEAELAVALVLQDGNDGTVASIAAGLAWLKNLECDVISLSLGWPGKHEEWAAAIETLLDGGAVIVTAVGNEVGIPGDENELSRSPANYPISPVNADQGILIAVGAHDNQNKVAGFSGGEIADWSSVQVTAPDGSKHPSIFAASPPKVVPDMVAPGVGVVEPIGPDIYESSSGSSMATPHIAGLVALILSILRTKSPDATPRQAATLLLQNLASLVPGAQVARQGHGKVAVAQLVTAINHA